MPDNKATSAVRRFLSKFRYRTDPDLFTASDAIKSSSRGDPNVVPPLSDLSSVSPSLFLDPAMELLQINDSYIEQVMDCTRLSESNIVFKAVTDKLCQSIGRPVTRIVIPRGRGVSQAKATKIERIFDQFLLRVGWEERKDTLIRRLLNEGGLSWELIVSSDDVREVRIMEYRPHHRIRPVLDGYGRFTSLDKSYVELDGRGKVVAEFPAWSMVDYNLVDSAYHNRGIPHLATARIMLSNVGHLVVGLVQKVRRSGGSIEHYNLQDATRWGDVELFKSTNREALEASPNSMVRALFTKGKVNVERLAGDASSASDTAVVSYLLDIILMAAGVPKSVLGFNSSDVIKNQADIVWQRHLDVLGFVESRLFYGLRKAFEFELLLNGIPEDSVRFELVGGNFRSVGPVSVTKEGIEAGAFSINDIRLSAGLPAVEDPMFDIPGLLINQENAERAAVDRGVAPGWLESKVEKDIEMREHMAELAASSAMSAAENNSDPQQGLDGKKPPAGIVRGPTPKATRWSKNSDNQE